MINYWESPNNSDIFHSSERLTKHFFFSFYEKCFVVVIVVILAFRGKPVTLRDALFCLFQDLLRSTEIDFVKTANGSRLRASLKMFTFPYFSVSS